MSPRALLWRGGGCLGVLALALVLQGCPARRGTSDGALRNGVATSMHRNALMDAAFGAAQQTVSPQEVFWQAELPLPQAQMVQEPPRAAASPQALPVAAAASMQLGDVQITPVLVRPREVIKLNDTQLAMVVESMAPDVAERAVSGAASAAAHSAAEPAPLYIGVIFFSRDHASGNDEKAPAAESWRARRLIPAVDVLTTQAEPADTQVYKLGSGDQYLMTYVQHRCHSGVCARDLKGYLLGADDMREALATRLSGGNVRAHADCDARLGERKHRGAALSASDAQAAAQATSDDASAATPMAMPTSTPMPRQASSGVARKLGKSANIATHVCYAIDGEVHPISREMATADVSLRFDGVVSEAPGQRRTVAQSQLFRLQGKQFVQVEGGTNPVPGAF